MSCSLLAGSLPYSKKFLQQNQDWGLSLMVNSQPIEQRRGIDSIDINQSVILVRASIEQVAQTLAQILEADSWERDAYDREIELLGQDFVVFQFRTHPWSIIHRQGSFRGKNFGEKDAQSLSELLQTRVIYYRASDTSGTIGYQFYDAGQLVERLYFDHSSCNGEELDDASNKKGRVLFRPSVFESRLRQLKAENIDSSYTFTHKFMREQDAYIPALRRPPSQAGQRVTLQLVAFGPETFKRNDFKRVDYVGVK